jgi:hypothetical protein
LGQEALTVLLQATSVNSPVAKKVVANLPPNERALVMSRLIDAMRQADWTKSVPGIHGATLLAKGEVILMEQLKAFTSGLAVESMDRGVSYLLKNTDLLGGK